MSREAKWLVLCAIEALALVGVLGYALRRRPATARQARHGRMLTAGAIGLTGMVLAHQPFALPTVLDAPLWIAGNTLTVLAFFWMADNLPDRLTPRRFRWPMRPAERADARAP